MKKIKLFQCLVFIALPFFAVVSCKKQTVPSPGSVATLNIVDALPGSLPMIPVQGTDGPVYTYLIPSLPQYGYYQSFKSAPTVSFGNTFLINPTAGILELYLVQNNADTMLVKGQASKYTFHQQIPVAAGNIYSLYITGTDTTAVDYLLSHDQLPVHNDSTCGIRFINLSASSNPVSVNVKGQSNGSEVQNLAYKNITSFKNYAATYGISNYTFEFRDAASGTLLASYTLSGVNNNTNTNGSTNTVLFNNMTICLIGRPGTQSTMLVNNF